MAIQGSSNQNQENASTQQGFTTPRRQSFMAGGMFGAPIAKGVGSEYLNKIAEGLKNEFKGVTNQDVEIGVHVVDKANEPALAFSVIVVSMRFKQAPGTVAAHVLLIEATSERPAPKFESAMGQQVEITFVTSDAFDRKLEAIVREKMAKAYPQATVNIIDGCVVPEYFQPDNQVHLHNLALNAGMACGTDLEIRRPDFKDFNIKSELQGTNIVVDILPSHGQIEDPIGAPVRSDVVINLRSQKPNQGPQDSLNSNDRDIPISSLSGFVDLLWAPVMQQNMNYWMPQAQQAPQKFAARLVLTNLQSNLGYTPSMVLLELVTAMCLNNDGNWIQVFRPTPGSGKELDLRDIGALNIQGNMENNQTGFGEPPDTKTRDFSLMDLGRFVATLVRPGLTISMDVPDAGPTTWYTSVFRDAAAGRQGAVDVIYAAAMELTNGQFANHFQKGTPMFEDLNNRIHLGHWTDNKGQRRDIRDIDYLAIANLHGRKDPQTLTAWSSTFLNHQIPIQMRLAQRKKMIDHSTNMSAVFNGFGTRVTFSAPFLMALMKGCMEAGMVPQVKTPLSAMDFNNTIASADWVNTTSLGPQQSFGHAGFGYQQATFGTRNTGFSRW